MQKVIGQTKAARKGRQLRSNSVQSESEIVDGQQRISTIAAFVSNEFALGTNARDFAGKKFEDLDEDTQETFWSYAVAVGPRAGAGRRIGGVGSVQSKHLIRANRRYQL